MRELRSYPPLTADPAFYSVEELRDLGFSTIGKNTRISRLCIFHAISGHIGDDVRIDDMCIMKGKVTIGAHVHIASFCVISGAQAPVVLKDFSSAALRTSIFSGTDDYMADTLSNPTVPKELTHQIVGPVTVGLSAMIGAHVVILPNVSIGDGASIGAGCVVYRSVPEGGILRMPRADLVVRRRNVSRIKELLCRVLDNERGHP